MEKISLKYAVLTFFWIKMLRLPASQKVKTSFFKPLRKDFQESIKIYLKFFSFFISSRINNYLINHNLYKALITLLKIENLSLINVNI